MIYLTGIGSNIARFHTEHKMVTQVRGRGEKATSAVLGKVESQLLT